VNFFTVFTVESNIAARRSDTSPQGYVSVAFYVVLIAAVIGLTAAGVLWISRRWPRTATETRQAS